jgi:multidrug resistance efflux pump
MLTLLTILYVVGLILLVRGGILPWNRWVKLSPIGFILILYFAFFVPMRGFAPAGDVRVLAAVIPIVPNVRGTVIEVPVVPNEPISQGEVLFRIDPRPYQYAVDRLEAALVAADAAAAQVFKQYVAAQAATAQAQAELESAESTFDRQAREAIEQARAFESKVQVDVDQSEVNLSRWQELLASQTVSQAGYDDVRRRRDMLVAQLAQAKSARAQAEENFAAGGTRLAAVRSALDGAKAREESARIAYQALADGVNPQVRQIMANLDEARWQLEETTVRAPSDGFVSNLALRPGATVGNLPMSPAMAFVSQESGLAMFVSQTTARHIEIGQPVEISMSLYPGRLLPGRVVGIVEGNRQGQVAVSGFLMSDRPEPRGPLMIRVEMDPSTDPLWIPPGSGGTAAVYTDKGRYTHIIRHAMMWINAWVNYMR